MKFKNWCKKNKIEYQEASDSCNQHILFIRYDEDKINELEKIKFNDYKYSHYYKGIAVGGKVKCYFDKLNGLWIEFRDKFPKNNPNDSLDTFKEVELTSWAFHDDYWHNFDEDTKVMFLLMAKELYNALENVDGG